MNDSYNIHFRKRQNLTNSLKCRARVAEGQRLVRILTCSLSYSKKAIDRFHLIESFYPSDLNHDNTVVNFVYNLYYMLGSLHLDSSIH